MIVYDLAALDRTLAATIFAGRIHYAVETGSTNNDALAAALHGAPHGSVWLTERQTAGRGRGDHEWLSTAGEGLYVSVLLRPQLELHRLALMPIATGLAAIEAIAATTNLKPDLRWPNDLLIGEQKCGGILAEARQDRGAAAYVVVGIGINVHQRAFPQDLSTPATSLDLATGRRVSRQPLLVRLLESLERETRALDAEDAGTVIPARLNAASSWVHGRRVEVHGPQACVGTTEGLDVNGFLLVRTREKLVTVQTGGIRAAQGE